jgi:hypothetical protein
MLEQTQAVFRSNTRGILENLDEENDDRKTI